MKYIQIITIITLFTFYSCGSDVKIDPKTDSIANENYKDSIRTLNNNLQYDNLIYWRFVGITPNLKNLYTSQQMKFMETCSTTLQLTIPQLSQMI